jgi:pentachlorophenol monooxygenase/3-(3-hydroxy-phenyl)propionate hydroxylase
VARHAAAATPGPVRLLALDEIDPERTLTTGMAAGPDEVWVVRPDAHVAAVLADPTADDITAALTRAAGHPATREESHDGALQASR